MSHIDGCFHSFDRDGDKLLNLEEFRLLCNALFRNDKSTVYELEDKRLKEIFDIFDSNRDGFIDIDEFTYCWYNWFRYIIRPRSVLIVVDIQNDFITGDLALSSCQSQQDGEEVIAPINAILNSVDFLEVIYTQDWHPTNHISFFENIFTRPIHATSKLTAEEAQPFDTVVFALSNPYEQMLWPRHCVENTWGAELHKDLKIVENSTKIYKGTHPDSDGCSAFKDCDQPEQSLLHALLTQKKVTDVYIVGLALDICVWYTAIDALSLNYRVIIIEDCCRGMNVEAMKAAKADIIAKHGIIVQSDQVKNMVDGKDRRAELGYQLAVKLKHDAQNTNKNNDDI